VREAELAKELLDQLAAASYGPMVLNVPAGQRLMPVERCLTECLHSLLGRSEQCPRTSLMEIAPTANHPALLRKFSTLAELLLADQTIGLGMVSQDRPLAASLSSPVPEFTAPAT